MIARREIFPCDTRVRPHVTRFRYQRSPGGLDLWPVGGARAKILRRRCLGMAQCNSARLPPPTGKRHRETLHDSGGTTLVVLAALADKAGKQSVLGLIEASAALGAIAAGFAWTRLRGEPWWTSALAAVLLLTATPQVGALATAPHLFLVGAFLVLCGAAAAPVLCGAAAAPVFVVAYTAADGLVMPEQRTEASSWVSTAINGGNATGTAVAGLVLAVGADAPFALAALLSASADSALLALLTKTPDPTTRTSEKPADRRLPRALIPLAPPTRRSWPRHRSRQVRRTGLSARHCPHSPKTGQVLVPTVTRSGGEVLSR